MVIIRHRGNQCPILIFEGLFPPPTPIYKTISVRLRQRFAIMVAGLHESIINPLTVKIRLVLLLKHNGCRGNRATTNLLLIRPSL